MGVQRAPDGKKLLEVFEIYVKENPIDQCVYCGEITSSNSHKFCGNTVFSSCMKIGDAVSIKQKMLKDLQAYTKRVTSKNDKNGGIYTHE